MSRFERVAGMNWAKGLFRVWLAASATWAGAILIMVIGETVRRKEDWWSDLPMAPSAAPVMGDPISARTGMFDDLTPGTAPPARGSGGPQTRLYPMLPHHRLPPTAGSPASPVFDTFDNLIPWSAFEIAGIIAAMTLPPIGAFLTFLILQWVWRGSERGTERAAQLPNPFPLNGPKLPAPYDNGQPTTAMTKAAMYSRFAILRL